MTLEEIYGNWSQDCKIDQLKIVEELSKIPTLHMKYLKEYTSAKIQLQNMKNKKSILVKDKYEYYNGTLDYDKMKEYGWSTYPLKILKSELPNYIDADKDIIDMNMKISICEEKVTALDHIVRQLANRNFIIKSMIDWRRFEAGS